MAVYAALISANRAVYLAFISAHRYGRLLSID